METNKTLKNSILKNLSYTSRDYEAILDELVKVFLGDNAITSDWDNISSSDPLFLILHLMAAHKDILNYQIDYSVLEGYMSTARERASVVRIANSFGYKIPSYRAGSAKYTFTLPEGAPDFDLEPFSTTPFLDERNRPWSYLDLNGNTADVVTLYQGYVERVEIYLGAIGPNNTFIFTNQRVAIGNSRDSKLLSRIVGPDGKALSKNLREVDNILDHTGEDIYVYELDVDTQRTTYIKFHRDLDFTDEEVFQDDYIILEYLITEGYEVSEARELEGVINGIPLTLTPEKGTFVRGQNPMEIEEIRESFKQYYSSKETLVTVNDYKNFLKNQRVVPNLGRLIVIDAGENTSTRTNIEIDKEGYINNLLPGEIKIFVEEEITEDEAKILEQEIEERQFVGSEVEVVTRDNGYGVALVVKIENIEEPSDEMKNAVYKVLKEYGDNVGFGEYIPVTDIYNIILSDPRLTRFPKGFTLKISVETGTPSEVGVQLAYNQVIKHYEIEYN